MGCDIHSFVMVPSSDAGLYQPSLSATHIAHTIIGEQSSLMMIATMKCLVY